MNDSLNDIKQTEEVMEETPVRVNPFCVVSKAAFGAYNVRDIQTNSGWSSNPYGEDYAIVPDELVEGIMETGGFCDIELNEDGTEIIGFTALEKPEIVEPEISTADKIAILKEQLAATDYKIIKCSEASLVGEELPYDITALHVERQAIREQINALEGA